MRIITKDNSDLSKPKKQPKLPKSSIKQPKSKNPSPSKGLKKATKKPSVAKLKKQADALFSRATRLRDSELVNGVYVAQCITCGVKKPYTELQAGHFVSRRVNALRFDELNVNAQCVSDNMFKQGDQYNYSIELDKKYGEGTAKSLHDRRNETHKFTVSELEEIIADSKAQIDFYLKQVDN